MLAGAVDIGGTKTLIGIIDEGGHILSSQSFATLPSPSEHLSHCIGVLGGLLQQRGLSLTDLCGLGVNVPGITDKEHSRIVHTPFLGWRDVPVREIFHRATGIRRIVVENDVNACAVGEIRFGHGATLRDFIWMTVSTGVGGAVVADGRLVTGHAGYAGELGHLKVELSHPHQCPCGQWGCLEAEGSGTAITREVHELAAQQPDFASALSANGLSADAKGAAALAGMGNPAALALYAQAGSYLGIGIAHCINVLNPQAVVLGGGVAESFSLLHPAIEAVIAKHALPSLQPVTLLHTKLGYAAALLGAAALVLPS